MFSSRKSISITLLFFALGLGMTSVLFAGEEEKNIAFTKRFYDEVMNKRNLKLIDELISADFVDHEEIPGIAPGREGLKQAYAMYFAAFPDVKIKIEDLIAKGDKVWVYYTVSGTHQGEFMGIPATNRAMEAKGFQIIRYANSKSVEHWGLFDVMTMMQQLGAIPAAEQAIK